MYSLDDGETIILLQTRPNRRLILPDSTYYYCIRHVFVASSCSSQFSHLSFFYSRTSSHPRTATSSRQIPVQQRSARPKTLTARTKGRRTTPLTCMEKGQARGSTLLARNEAPRLRGPHLRTTAMEDSSWRKPHSQRTPTGASVFISFASSPDIVNSLRERLRTCSSSFRLPCSSSYPSWSCYFPSH